MSFKLKLIIYTFAIAFSAGCTVGPDYKKPELENLDLSVDDSSQAVVTEDYDPNDIISWWKNFDDPVMTQLISETLASNNSLQQAKARVSQARAVLGMEQSFDYPTLNMNGSYSHTNYSVDTRNGGTFDVHTAGFDAGWELDIFGGTRRAIEAATADLQTVEADLEDVWVSLAAETAITYIDLRTAQKQLQVAKDNLKAQSETLDILKSSMEAGLGNGLAVKQAEYNMETTRSTIPEFVIAVESAQNKLAVLTGKMPGQLNEMLSNVKEIPTVSEDFIIHIPADTLRNRPDVRSAERMLAAQNARIGQATADLYPKFRLNGSVGYEAFQLNRLFDSGNDYYSFGPSIGWNIFDGDYIKNSIKVQDAIYQQYDAQYKSTVLNAVAEVRDTLVSWKQQQDKLTSVMAAEQAASSALTLAEDQYSNGFTDFNNVLDAQRALLSLQSQKVASQGQITSNLIRLYKSLGGGWPGPALEK